MPTERTEHQVAERPARIISLRPLGDGRRARMVVQGALARWTLERTGDNEIIFPSFPLSKMLGCSISRLIRESGDRIFFRFASREGRFVKEYLLAEEEAQAYIVRSGTQQADALVAELAEVLKIAALVLLQPEACAAALAA